MDITVHSYLIESNPYCVICRWSVFLLPIGSCSENMTMTALETHALARIVKHPKFNETTILEWDAGIVKLETPVVESAVRKPNALVAAGEVGAAGEPNVVSGWGDTKASALFKNVNLT